MTYLELCQSLAKESGTNNDLSKPTTVVGQTDEYLAIVEWIKQAWTDIQTFRDNWKFMWADDFSKDTVVGETLLDISSDSVARFDEETFTYYKKSVGTSDRSYLAFSPWYEVKQYYRSISADNQEPSIITQQPNTKLNLVYPADDIYTVQATYYRTPQIFSANTDVPTGLPTEFHMAIVYKALFDYGAFQDAVEQMTRSERRYGEDLLQNMNWSQVQDGDPVVTPQ